MSCFERYYCSNHIGCGREFDKEARPKLHLQVRVKRAVLNDNGVVSQGIQLLRLVRPNDARHAPSSSVLNLIQQFSSWSCLTNIWASLKAPRPLDLSLFSCRLIFRTYRRNTTSGRSRKHGEVCRAFMEPSEANACHANKHMLRS